MQKALAGHCEVQIQNQDRPTDRPVVALFDVFNLKSPPSLPLPVQPPWCFHSGCCWRRKFFN